MAKRILKILLILCCIPATLALLCALALGVAYAKYASVVRQTPGGLAVASQPGELGSEVNVFAGTGGYFYLCPYDSPAATTPFGMVRVAPDTASLFLNKTALNGAGYYYADNKIIGFSQNRLVGADTEEGGSFRIIPTLASRVYEVIAEGQFAQFSHRDETAFPGFYAVKLPELGVLAELTATPRTAIHRYTFSKDEMPHLLLDVSSSLGGRRVEGGLVWVHPNNREIEGSITTFGSFSGRYGGLRVHFAARFSQPFTDHGTWNEDRFTPGGDSAAGDKIGVDLAFAKTGPELTIEARVALSYVSITSARANLDAEGGAAFDEAAAKAREQWEGVLGRIRIEGGTPDQRAIFYSALYRSFLMPTLFCDVDGQYMGFDKKVHEAGDYTYYTDFSLWDTFRTVHPLFTLIARAEQRDMLVSLTEMAKQGGSLPRWPAGCGYTGCMFGSPADMVITGSYLKGIRDFDAEAAYAAMCRTARGETPPGMDRRRAIEHYLVNGYLPNEKVSKSVARTLEFAYADSAIARLAEALGKTEDAKEFAAHGQFYRNLWDPETQYFRPKNVLGQFYLELKPTLLTYEEELLGGELTRAYCEGSALQWRWGAPYDAQGLISLFKSKEYFVEELNAFFEGCTAKMGAWHPGGYYWQGNEPDLHAAYLFGEADRPDLTQKWVRWILDTRYANNYVGLDGNDDGGTLSAWYVFSALGFYPQAGSDRYWLAAPLFPKATLDIAGKKLEVIANDYAPGNIYADAVRINGKELDRWWFQHDEIADGGVIEFDMCPAWPR